VGLPKRECTARNHWGALKGISLGKTVIGAAWKKKIEPGPRSNVNNPTSEQDGKNDTKAKSKNKKWEANLPRRTVRGEPDDQRGIREFLVAEDRRSFQSQGHTGINRHMAEEALEKKKVEPVPLHGTSGGDRLREGTGQLGGEARL